MSNNKKHALLSPSAAHRWLNCPKAPRLEATVEDTGSDYAREGSLAHAYCARKLKATLGRDTQAEEAEIAELRSQYHTGEMDGYTDAYAAEVLDRYNTAKATTRDAVLAVETRLELEEWIPGAHGTADATIIADETMEIIDFKYGKGVRVEAPDNPQMMIYALGAWAQFNWLYAIERVRMTIIQPRLDNVSSWTVSVDALLEWADEVLRPRALAAYAGDGEATPGEWCRFCKVKSQCAALAGKCRDVAESVTDPALMTPERMAADVLPWLATIKSWVSGVEEYALAQALGGVRYPGYKLVEGRSVRRITDEGAVAEALAREGYAPEEYLKPAALYGIGELERMMGKKRFALVCGDYIEKPRGKPALAPASDKRAEYTPGDDFEGVVHDS